MGPTFLRAFSRSCMLSRRHSQTRRWHPVVDLAALQAEVAARTLDLAAAAIQTRGRFAVVLAGGNTPRGLYERLSAAESDWSRWHVYFGDERCVASDSALRNSRMVESAWLGRSPIPARQIHAMPAELGPEEGAARYAALLASVGWFDLVLLGLGEDGHTASLFTGHDMGEAVGAPAVLPVTNAPKPPAARLTLSARRLSRTHAAIFLVAGRSKQQAVARWRAGERMPASSIIPPAGVDIYIEGDLLAN
jgi:6-phosphogluconolactonase